VAAGARLSRPAKLRPVDFWATVIDGTGSAPLRDATVLTRDGRIEQAGPSRTVRIPDGATRIDATNRFLIPGLIDTHFHIAARIGRPELDRILAAAIAHGVTGIRDASGLGREEQLVELRDELERGTRPRPHLYVSGGATTQNLTRYKAADPAALVRQLRELGVDGVKLRNFRAEQAVAAIRAAKSERLPVYGHTYG
jgi:imidazolonepropionase-like amidohydrolase